MWASGAKGGCPRIPTFLVTLTADEGLPCRVKSVNTTRHLLWLVPSAHNSIMDNFTLYHLREIKLPRISHSAKRRKIVQARVVVTAVDATPTFLSIAGLSVPTFWPPARARSCPIA